MSSKARVGLICCALLYLLCSPALAQTNIQFPPDCCQIGPTGAQVAGAVIGAAVVIGVIVYLAVPKQTTIEGCVTSSDGTPQIINERDHKSYLLLSDQFAIAPGQRMKLKGKKGKDKSGVRPLRVKKILKDEGTCTP
jgi:hypothetical protein